MSFPKKRWYRTRKNQVLIFALLFVFITYYICLYSGAQTENHDLTRRFIEETLQVALKYDKGTGCDIPHLDPFSEEVTRFDVHLPKVTCNGEDWVKCYMSECKVKPEILDKYKNIVCHYTDILYITDYKRTLGKTTEVLGADVYQLTQSDHVYVKCAGKDLNAYGSSLWSGYATGLRPVTPPKSPVGRENTFNVLIFGYDTTAKNGFIRRMPLSYRYLLDEVGATIFNGYNILGDGTPAALFPILTGQTELELPDVRKVMNKDTMDSFPFIFYKLKKDGYHTAYFEDSPDIGTFQYRFNGFKKQPADHYLRALLLQKIHDGGTSYKHSKLCFGDTPLFKVMINLTEQFMSLPGKKFVFNFIADITHDDFNHIQTADEDTVNFLANFMKSGLRENTLLIVMGDHGPRYANVRKTMQGKLEERLPLLAIRLPDRLVKERPEALNNLKRNVDVLTTPHDLHATILDTLDMRQYWNPYKIAGADLTRGLTMLEPIPGSRSCSEAGVEPHWCACLAWTNVSADEPLYQRAADKLLEYINRETEVKRSQCAIRRIKSVDWVIIHRVRDGVAEFISSKDTDGYTGKFKKNDDIKDIVQVKITVSPGEGMFEASLSYTRSTKELKVNPREISRINEYRHEPDCISATHPHLNPYCYCND